MHFALTLGALVPGALTLGALSGMDLIESYFMLQGNRNQV